MSLRMAPEQISLTFSSQLVTAGYQKSTASVCHCHLPRPGRAVWEAALQRTPEIGSERRRKYHRVWHATQHTPPSGHTLRGPYCVYSYEMYGHCLQFRDIHGKYSSWSWRGGGGVISTCTASHVDPQWEPHTLQTPVPQGVWYHW